MSVTFKITNHEDFLRLDVSGEYMPGTVAEEAINIWARTADACREHSKSRVLMVNDVPGAMPTIAAFEIASNPSEIGWDPRVKIALVYTHKERFESNIFSETVARNRYLNVKAFQDEPAAISWLLGT